MNEEQLSVFQVYQQKSFVFAAMTIKGWHGGIADWASLPTWNKIYDNRILCIATESGTSSQGWRNFWAGYEHCWIGWEWNTNGSMVPAFSLKILRAPFWQNKSNFKRSENGVCLDLDFEWYKEFFVVSSCRNKIYGSRVESVQEVFGHFKEDEPVTVGVVS